jgi:hypothetical protein
MADDQQWLRYTKRSLLELYWSSGKGLNTNKHNLSFDLKGNKITCEENVKLLGITVDSHLNFDKHKGIVICIIINSTILNKVKNVIYKNIK